MGTLRGTGNVVWIMFALIGCGQSGDRNPAGEGPQAEEQLAVPSRKGEFTTATDVFGRLRVRAGSFSAESRTRPWSSWWLPTRETYLFRESEGQLAPLQKYDLYSGMAKGTVSLSAKYEEQYLYNPAASAWEGRCDAWSFASLMEEEPVVPVVRRGITFGVGDQKALLLKKYERFQGAQVYGQRYNGDRHSFFDDLYPDQFHLLMQHELFDRGKPFIMDKDPGVEVWNTPVWMAETRVTRDETDPHLLHVITWIWGADPFVNSYDYVGTKGIRFEYTYDLIGTEQPDGSYLIVYGEWTGASLDYHPDFFTLLPDAIVTESLNKELDIVLIDQIVRGK